MLNVLLLIQIASLFYRAQPLVNGLISARDCGRLLKLLVAVSCLKKLLPPATNH